MEEIKEIHNLEKRLGVSHKTTLQDIKNEINRRNIVVKD
jgi:hypothetical protein